MMDWDGDGNSPDMFDIGGNDNSLGQTNQYDIASGTWTGDDYEGDGEADGRDDNRSSDYDAYIMFNIETV